MMELVLGIASVGIDVALFVAYIFQIKAMKKQIKIMENQLNSDTIKHNSDTTLNVLTTWTNGLTSDMVRSRKIVEKFSLDNCKSLYNCETFNVTSAEYKEICVRMGNPDKKAEEKSLNTEEINTLRDDCIKYLNLLEVVLSSRILNTVNSEIIEKEFRYLVKPENKDSVLQNFRIACGGKSAYPSIEDYCEKISNEDKKTN